MRGHRPGDVTSVMTRMRRRRRYVAIAALSVLTIALPIGCGTDGSPVTPSQPELSGFFTGTWISTAPAYGGSSGLEGQFRQSGSTIEATVIMQEHLCVTSLAAEGALSGDQVTFSITGVGGDRTDFTGTVSGDRMTMSGSYEMSGGWCPPLAGSADRGTWTLTR